MRKNSYKFFQNKECEYFPCHKVECVDNFNCLFCYCPLYLQKNCIGTPSYFLDPKGQKIKDCSQCTVVHQPEMYEKVLERLGQKEEILSVNIGNLREDIWERMAQIASWDKMDKEMYREHRAKAIHNIATVLEQYKYLYRVPVLLQPFSAECVQDGYFEFGGQKIPCRVLTKIDRSQVEGGYLYTFHAPDRKVAEDDALLKQYYFEIFQIACLDVIRDWLQGYLGRKHSVMEERYCSPAFGPGFYGMEMEMTETLLALMNAEKAGVSYENGSMQPAMSVAGIYLVSKEDVLPVCRDCEDCIGQKSGCEFCKIYTR